MDLFDYTDTQLQQMLQKSLLSDDERQQINRELARREREYLDSHPSQDF